MSSIATSNTVPNKTQENIAIQSANPSMLVALQDFCTFFGVELQGTFIRSGNVTLNGNAARGGFHIKP